MIRRIVVPLDCSAFGNHALPYALTIADRVGAEIELAHVHVRQVPVPEGEALTPYRFEHVVEWDSGREQTAFGYEVEDLEAQAAQLSASWGLSVSATVKRGVVGPTLLGAIEEADADLVVMSTHGRTGLRRSWLGSIADFLIHRLAVPVLVIRPDDAGRAPVDVDIRHILVPIDGSAFSAEIMPVANRLANGLGARVTLLQVVPQTVGAGKHEPDVRESYIEWRESDALQHLSDLADRYEWPGERPRLSVVAKNNPDRMILHAAEHWGVDMIAMATHGRGGVSRAVLGSVTDRVVRETHKPLLLYRPGRKGRKRDG